MSSVLITGCSPEGIGHALAKEYHGRGFRVFATARRPEVLEDLANLGIMTLALDVTSVDSVRAVRELVSENTGGKLDILVNNAGLYYAAPGAENDIDRVRTMFETNIFGVMRMVAEFVELLVTTKGQILNIGSVNAIVPMIFTGAYSASKAALQAYSDILRIELAPLGVNVTTIVTGGVRTPMNEPEISRPAPFRLRSLYEPVADLYISKRDETMKKGITTAAEYARHVVSCTAGRPPAARLYKGFYASRLHWLFVLLPHSALSVFFARAFGADKFQPLLSNSRKIL